MKTAFLLAAAVGVAMAQDFSGQPACATSCLASAISAAGCGPNDIACQCGPTQSVIAASAVPCLLRACQPSELGQAQTAGEARCAAFRSTAGIPATTTGGAVTLTSNSTITTQTTLSGTTSSLSSTRSGSTSSVSGRTPTTAGGRSASTTTTQSSTSRQGPPTSANAATVQAGVGAGLVMAFLGAVAAL